MSKSGKDAFEKIFGKRPETGYEFTHIEINVMDSNNFKGLEFNWSATGMGFGQVYISWGTGEEIKKDWPRQYGFHTDSECMNHEFVEALMVASAPKLAKLIMENEKK